ncbi:MULTISPECIES: copper resistance protein CopC [unclassified Streptomyces]|uniref:copper resistance CopC/CopD family protein n=1 Tax=unclassified Streptomyces TaxID=2593676 RepID=UPI0004C82206|nr:MULTISPECIES: copper resistance protein CopC [unclassified Streptomyces]
MLLGTVLVLLLGGAAPASAHAALRGSDPDDGSVVKQAPRQVTLTFTESVGLLDDSFRIFGPDQRRVRTGEAQHADGRSDTARVGLPGKLTQGTYTVAWRVVSSDSHPVSGAFTFSIGKRTATSAQIDTGPSEDPLTGGLYDAARYLAYLAAALLVGTVAFALLCRPADTSALRRPLVSAWWTLLGSTVVLLFLRAPYEAGAGPVAAFDASALVRTLTSRPGWALLARLVILLLAAVFLARLARSRDRQKPVVLAAGAALAVALALTWAAAEHASAGIQVPLAMTSSVLHLVATGVWLGGLVALLLTMRRASGDVLREVVPRFSGIAFASVIVLALTGLYQSWRGLGSLSALSGTSYGRLLLAKLVAVTVLLMAAGYSRRWTARLAAPVAVAVRTAVPERVPQPVGAPPPPDVTERAGTGEPGPGGESRPTGESGKPGQPEDAHMPDGPRPDGPAPDGPAPDGPAPDGPAVESGDTDAQRRGLRRSVLVEVAVAAVVLLITTLLTTTLPARAQAEAAQQAPVGALPPTSLTVVPFDMGGSTGNTLSSRGSVYVTLDPARVGVNGVQAVVHGADEGPIIVPEVRITFTLPSRKIGPIDAELTDAGGYWGTNSVNLPLPGTWTMKTTVRVSDVDQVTVSRKVRIVP